MQEQTDSKSLRVLRSEGRINSKWTQFHFLASYSLFTKKIQAFLMLCTRCIFMNYVSLLPKSAHDVIYRFTLKELNIS